ncbi:DoxX family membrane protein [Luteimicrobium subarcticum]|uniref:DoxX-like protein n=1 Tax=Luteimicrobium subarcticum TaxID=620910 RepID=A0A2M8WWC4_9MICO|nr:DoxX family membrane protein [Luteimicrobium subarcticum]PJI95221.1 DoxX-like protein [Luteimicrobium subarcticum]
MLLRHVARPLLAAPFVLDGLDAALRPARHVVAAEATVEKLSARVPSVPPVSRRNLTLAVRVHGAVTAVAGLALAFHKSPRSAALLLAALTAPLAIADEPFTGRPETRRDRAKPFVHDLGLLGAALLAAADTEGRPGVVWRVRSARVRRHAVHDAVAEATAE